MKFKPQQLSFFMAIFFSMALIQGMSYLIRPPEIGEILAVERSEDSTEVRAVITAEKAQIKLFFVKPVPYQSPARIDVIAKDLKGHELLASNEAILLAVPDSLYKAYNLPK